MLQAAFSALYAKFAILLTQKLGTMLRNAVINGVNGFFAGLTTALAADPNLAIFAGSVTAVGGFVIGAINTLWQIDPSTPAS